MENNFLLTDDLLWDYADGFLDPGEKLRVETYLQRHPEYQAKLQAILLEKRALSALTPDQPGSDFAPQLMKAWQAEQALNMDVLPAKSTGRDWVLWAIGLTFGFMVAIPVIFSPATEVPQNLQIPEGYLPDVELPRLDWYGIFNSASLHISLLLFMAFLGLKLLDKFLQLRLLRVSGK